MSLCRYDNDVKIDQADDLNAGSDEICINSQDVGQSVSDYAAVEPDLKLPVLPRSKLLHFRPSHCCINRTAYTLALYFDDDERCINIDLAGGTARTDSAASPSEHLTDSRRLNTGPPVLMCRGLYTTMKLTQNLLQQLIV